MEKSTNPIKKKLHEIIFEADTPSGKLFDVILFIFIFISVILVILETLPGVENHYRQIFYALEWLLTILFTIEYGTRLYCVNKPSKYALSFYGIIDLVSILPTYLSLIFNGTQYLLIIRALRLLRIFRVFKLGHFLYEGNLLVKALQRSRRKITIFLFFILITVSIVGTVMFLIEGSINEGFSSIPKSMYWVIVTLTTVGFGDITPISNLGRFIASCVMILGYAVIAVPTGIVSSEITQINPKKVTTQACINCGEEGHDQDATFCKYCGEALH